MECKACGHKHKVLNDDWELEHTDTKAFILINGHFTIDWGNGYNNSQQEVSLYACPECDTVQLNKW